MIPLLFLLLLVPWTAAGQSPAADRAGCVESKVVTRMPGCVILRCEYKDFAAADMPRTKTERNHAVEGRLEHLVYRCPAGKSPLELGRNTENALKNAGFEVFYTDVYAGGARFYMTARKGEHWVRLNVLSDMYELYVVQTKAMEQVMTANAEGWAAEVERTGRVAVYGINFDTAKATLRPDSEPVLNEVLKLLQTNGNWAVLVAGHTDSAGTPEANLVLSRQRAEAVIGWLAGRGLEKVRLVPAGFGQTRPVADNATEAGRQKNRRVDLVKLY